MEARFDLPPSAWVQRWAPSIRPGGVVLDVAAGSGRHARLLARMGFEVEAVDRDASLFADPPPRVKVVEADLEAGPWPFAGPRFDGGVVTNYLHPPLLAGVVDCLERGGVLLHRTLPPGHEAFGQPSQ